jgi:hypothetical protein
VSSPGQTLLPLGAGAAARLATYGRICGWTLSRACARTRNRIEILDASDVFDRALVEFAEAYADLNERDHDALVRAVREGRIDARSGV